MPLTYLTTFRAISTQFWQHNPAMLYGLMALCGASFVLYRDLWPLLSLTLLAILLSLGNPIQRTLASLLILATAYLTHQQYLVPKDLNNPVEGLAVVEINAIKSSKSPFGESRLYRGTLTSFTPDEGTIAKNIPITISEPINEPIRPVNTAYEIRGRLRSSPQGRFSLAPDKKSPWKPLQYHPTLAHWRYSGKRAFQETINANIVDPHTAAFLSGIAVGEFDDMQLSMELGRLGLQHLMAISGIHFSIIAGILTFFFAMLLGKRSASLAVLIMLTLYFIFLGHSPSVLRAWIAIAIALGTAFAQRTNRALNSLGLGLLAIALIDPLSIGTIPFQFSFGVTASILLWFKPCDTLLSKIFRTRSLSKITRMGWMEQHGYCILYSLRQGLSLTLAVNLIALPISLFYFQKFSLMSLFYNLFFPFLVSISMLLLLLALPFILLVPPVGNFFLSFNEKYTKFLLDFVFNLPKEFDVTWVIYGMDPYWVLALVIATLGLGIGAHGLVSHEQDL